ncbi:MAG: tetratricopeptide repeat protein, partial [Chloroflexota bacterium]|nr:tetratricopeptide repeat protein [Chloroflexota bacterium]
MLESIGVAFATSALSFSAKKGLQWIRGPEIERKLARCYKQSVNSLLKELASQGWSAARCEALERSLSTEEIQEAAAGIVFGGVAPSEADLGGHFKYGVVREEEVATSPAEIRTFIEQVFIVGFIAKVDELLPECIEDSDAQIGELRDQQRHRELVALINQIGLSKQEREIPKAITPRIPRISPNKIVGRKGDVDDLHRRLFDNKQVVLVNGLGGIGKTTLAHAYVGKYWEEYHHIAWIGQTSEDIVGDFVNTEGLLTNLNIQIQGKDPRQLFLEILTRLNSVVEQPGLLIIDNADVSLTQWYDCLPRQPEWHLLATSRQRIERFDVKELDFLSRKEAVDLFLCHYSRGKITPEEIGEIVDLVDLHTLTIEILAKTAQLQRTGIFELEKAIEEDLIANVYIDHKGDKIGRITSYLCSILNVSELDEEVIWLLQQFACLPPEFHNYELLRDLINPEASGRESLFSETLEGLAEKGWLLRDQALDSYKMHRIIADVVKKQHPLSLAEAQPLIDSITEKLSIDQTKDNPVDKFPWMPYGTSVLKVFPSSSDVGISRLQNNLATVLKDLGDYEGAKELLEKAKRSAEKNFGQDHPTTAVSYSNL